MSFWNKQNWGGVSNKRDERFSFAVAATLVFFLGIDNCFSRHVATLDALGFWSFQQLCNFYSMPDWHEEAIVGQTKSDRCINNNDNNNSSSNSIDWYLNNLDAQIKNDNWLHPPLKTELQLVMMMMMLVMTMNVFLTLGWSRSSGANC